MSLLIKGGEIVTGDEHFIGDIYCEHERITHIDRNIDAPAGAEVINASGKYVFPGFIDPHVHIYLPFMGTFSKDTYETASKAALGGGFDWPRATSREPAAARGSGRRSSFDDVCRTDGRARLHCPLELR